MNNIFIYMFKMNSLAHSTHVPIHPPLSLNLINLCIRQYDVVEFLEPRAYDFFFSCG